MAKPDYVPLTRADQVRETEKLPAPDAWRPDRPAELVNLRPAEGRRLGTAGPDQGYGLKLAKHFHDRLQVTGGEHRADAISGCLGIGLRRASLYGRAPVIYDFELAYALWGFLGGAPSDLVEFRKPLFAEASHDYFKQRDIADRVPEETLRLKPIDVQNDMGNWRSRLALGT